MNIKTLLSDENPAFLKPAATTNFITAAIRDESPKLIARFGSVEGRVVAHYLLGLKDGNAQRLPNMAQENAGICQSTPENLRKFSCEYLAAAANTDLLAVWDFPNQAELVLASAPTQVCSLVAINPVHALFRESRLWTTALEGKRVLVIHPFAQSVKAQYENRTNIPSVHKLLPEFELTTLIPPVTNGNVDYAKAWHIYLAELKQRVLHQNFDVAIVAAGAYGLPIASFIKAIGKTAIHLGGVTQLIFGIQGKRWESKRYTKALDQTGWIRPSTDETPAFAATIEGGCYW